jgi:hypothetical protein
MARADWPLLHFHDCLVDRPCRFCATSDLGHLADPLALGATDQKMTKAIWDKATGVQLGWIEDGKVFAVGMNEPIGHVREGKVFKHGGVLVCYLASLNSGEIPKAFKKFLEKEMDERKQD